jgi:hypothetical protein
VRGLGFRIVSYCCLDSGVPRGVGRATANGEGATKAQSGGGGGEHKEEHNHRDNID